MPLGRPALVAVLTAFAFAALPAASDILEEATGWRLVPCPGLLPDAQFFALLARRRFPVTEWIRRPEELDYIVEPDIFHDFLGHVPLLTNPDYAGFLEAYGRLGLLAEREGLSQASQLRGAADAAQQALEAAQADAAAAQARLKDMQQTAEVISRAICRPQAILRAQLSVPCRSREL